METVRIIPRLDIKGPNLVKGIHLEGLRVLGKPEHFAEYYYINHADELMFVDVVASLYERNSLHDIIKRTAKKIFIPLTVSGGIRSIDDIRGVLRAGADKVSLNTAAIHDPDLIRKASREFGSSTIVVTVEAIKQEDGRYLAYTDNGREHTGIEVVDWAEKAEEMGAGEIVITSVDNEGTGAGFDIELTRAVSKAVTVPVIAHGGAGSPLHVIDVIKKGYADAVSMASILHYHALDEIRESEDFLDEGNTEFLNYGKKSEKFSYTDLISMKGYLADENVYCRP
ncbi:MAG: imidazole glycerol phosphate synthase subunit HisF [Desulfobacter sp.]|nr:MAG: imidazole glycerol phosphate synthase subunit HisF [Desulfobacter sp.]